MTTTPINNQIIYNENNRLTNFLKEKEGFRALPYLDQAGLPHIGYGSRFYEDGTPVTMQDGAIDEARATTLMNNYVDSVAKNLENMPGFNELNPYEKDAIISFGYNFGENFYTDKDNFGIISGAVEKGDRQAIMDAFGLYVNVADDTNEKGYSESQGLVNRRKAEVKLFNTPYVINKPKSKYDEFMTDEN